MTGNTQFLMQSVATVLPFAPPGLLLVATFLQLRNSPVSRLLSAIRDERLRLSQATGSGRESFLWKCAAARGLHETLCKARRNGEDITPRLALIEDNLQKLGDEEQELVDAFAGLCARTALALTFTVTLVLIMKAAGSTNQSQTSQAVATGTACAGLMLAGVLLPVRNLRRAGRELDIMTPPNGDLLAQWLLKGRCHGGEDEDLTRSGIFDSAAATREGDQLFRDLRSRTRMSLAKAVRMTSVYEVMTLAPSSALLVAGNWI